MSGIRVTYSGLISFVGGLILVFTSTLFTLILTRTLNPTEYGTWGLINGLIFYVLMIGPVVSYWTTREVARGSTSGKTSILSSGILSAIGSVAYVIIAYLVGHQTNVDQSLLLFAVIIIPFIFLNGILTAINLGSKPQAVAYGSISLGMAQIITVLILVHFFSMGVKGVILSFVLSYIASNVVLLIYARNKIKDKFRKEYLVKWFHLSWVPLYPGLAIVVAKLDVVIFSIATGSVIGLAFWTAAMALPSTISNSSLLSRGVYSKLLEGGGKKYVQENITRIFYLAIPFASISITFARPALFALNPIYETAFPVVIFLTIYMFFNVLSNVFLSYLTGVDKVDENTNATFKDYIKSKLFILPTLRLVQYSIYISLLGITLLWLAKSTPQIDLLIYWSAIILATEIPVSIYLYRLVRRNFSVTLEIGSVSKYFLISSIVFGIAYLLSVRFLHYTNNLFDFLPNLLLFIILGVIAYIVLTYVADSKTRKLFKSIICEMREKI